MPELYLQLGFYASIVLGFSVLTNRLYRARALLAKYVEAKIAHAPEPQLQRWAAWPMWNLGDRHTPHVTSHGSELRASWLLLVHLCSGLFHGASQVKTCDAPLKSPQQRRTSLSTMILQVTSFQSWTTTEVISTY